MVHQLAPVAEDTGHGREAVEYDTFPVMAHDSGVMVTEIIYKPSVSSMLTFCKWNRK